MKYLLLFTAYCCLMASAPAHLSAQSIRKDYREFTTQELTDFKAAILEMAPIEIPFDFNYYYAYNYCDNINTTWGNTCHPAQYGEYYLPWHRTLLLDVEYRMRNMPGSTNNNPYRYLSLPYWDWTTDNNPNATHFWDINLLDENQYVPDLNITRCLGNGSSCSNGILPTTSDIQAALSLTTYYNNTLGPVQWNAPDFTHRMEAISLSVKKWVGPTTESLGGLEDPASFLHHAMLDKVWQEWEDQTPGQQSAIINGNQGMSPVSSASILPIVAANQVFDSRYIPVATSGARPEDVWYAAQGKVLLNGSNGQNFIAYDVNQPYLYRYTAAGTNGNVGGGKIYVGDIKRDASNNVIPDQKGGFLIASSVQCDFRAGASIEFLPGFEAALGAVSEAKIISLPNGFAPEPGTGERENTTRAYEVAEVPMRCMPNPVTDRATLEYELAQESNVLLKVLDVSGKIVSEASPGIQVAGTHQYQLDASDLTPGIYCWLVDINGKTQTLKFVKNQH